MAMLPWGWTLIPEAQSITLQVDLDLACFSHHLPFLLPIHTFGSLALHFPYSIFHMLLLNKA